MQISGEKIIHRFFFSWTYLLGLRADAESWLVAADIGVSRTAVLERPGESVRSLDEERNQFML